MCSVPRQEIQTKITSGEIDVNIRKNNRGNETINETKERKRGKQWKETNEHAKVKK
jgi:hypothetical protein